MPTAGGNFSRRLLSLHTYSYNEMHLSYKITEDVKLRLINYSSQEIPSKLSRIKEFPNLLYANSLF